MSFFNYVCTPCYNHPKKFISYAWVVSLVFVAIIFIIACVYADKQKGKDAANAFAVVWTSLLCLALSVGGTLVMRKYQTPLAIGYLLGVVAMMSQQCLILFAVFVKLDEPVADNADNAAAAFLFLLFCIYGIFGTLLGTFRNRILQDSDGSGGSGSGDNNLSQTL